MFLTRKINSNIVYYSDLIPEIEHFFTTRNLILKGDYNDLHIQNLISKNTNIICSYLNVSKNNFISPEQTHSSHIEFVNKNKLYPETDALILADYEHAVYLNFADCVPVVLYDKRADIAAVAHAGRRGTADGITVKTVKKMIDYTQSDLSDIYAVIGAAIGGCCYEVGADIVNEIKSSVKNSNDIVKYKNNSAYIDLKLANARQLIEMGVPFSNIDICSLCTSCRNDLFFSYRKEHGTLCRHSAVIKLKQI